MNKNNQRGVTLIEVIIAISIATIMLMTVGFSVTTYVDTRTNLLSDTKAVYLAEEGYEILRTIRDDDWNILSTLVIGTTYYLDITPTTLGVTNTPEIIDGEFYREFEISRVSRDINGDIVDSGGTVDPNTLHFTISAGGPAGTTTLDVLITNIHAI